MASKQDHTCFSISGYVCNHLHLFLLFAWLKATRTFPNLIEQKLTLLPGYTGFLCFINLNNVTTKTAL